MKCSIDGCQANATDFGYKNQYSVSDFKHTLLLFSLDATFAGHSERCAGGEYHGSAGSRKRKGRISSKGGSYG